MKKVAFVAVAMGLLCFASQANAQLQILVELDGTAVIENVGTEALRFDGYTIASANGVLSPGDWVSLTDSFAADPLGAIAALGVHGMATANPSENNLSELSAGTGATLQPGASWGIGSPFGAGNTNWDDATFEYTDPDGIAGGGTQPGDIVLVPEPGTWALAALAFLGLAAIRRRK